MSGYGQGLPGIKPESRSAPPRPFIQALRSSGKQCFGLLPVMLGVALLTGMFDAFVSKELLTGIFSENTVLDALWDAGC